MTLILINAVVSIILMLLGALLIRRETKARTEGLVVEQFNKLVHSQNEVIDTQAKKIEENRQVIQELRKDHDDCEYSHDVTKLELAQIKKLIDLNSLPRATVFILDDNKMVVMEFQKRFREISVLDCKTFTNPTAFLKDAQTEKPEIVILDYTLSDHLNAEHVIEDLGYMPSVFIMSANKEIQLRIKEKGMQFFYKDDHYVSKIAKAVIQYLYDKI